MLIILLSIAAHSGGLFRGSNYPLTTHVSAQGSGDFTGPESCNACHAKQYEEWSETAHSQAFADPIFQDEWTEQGSPDECLECHTTGYDPTTGTFALEGVTCESCHGEGLTMEVDTSPGLCGSCHTGQYGKNKFEEFSGGIHFDSGVVCADCHMHDKSHTFEVEAKACATCHTDDDIHARRMILDLQGQVFEAEERATQLEEEYNELLSEVSEIEERTAIVTQITIWGAAAMGLLGVVVAVSYLRHRGSE